MARSCGIHIGQRRWAVVVLEGSAKKHRILLQEDGDVPEGDDPIQATAKELREVAKRGLEARRRDNVVGLEDDRLRAGRVEGVDAVGLADPLDALD